MRRSLKNAFVGAAVAGGVGFFASVFDDGLQKEDAGTIGLAATAGLIGSAVATGRERRYWETKVKEDAPALQPGEPS